MTVCAVGLMTACTQKQAVVSVPQSQIDLEKLIDSIDYDMDITGLPMGDVRTLSYAPAATRGFPMKDAYVRAMYETTTWYDSLMWAFEDLSPAHMEKIPMKEGEDWYDYYDRAINEANVLGYSEKELAFIKRLQAMHTVIPMSYNSEVRTHIKFYLKYMSRRLDVMLMLSEYYRPLFLDALNRYGVPEELKYLPIVESAMNPMATSRVGAAGLWQFMYSTGSDYGLEVNSVVDERRDAYKSTHAAARYLNNLHRTFGDWALAIAAYNCGPGTINKAIARSGGKRDFWEIYPYLPRETRGYIPAQ